MKTTSFTTRTFGIAAVLAMNVCAIAQNTSLNTDNIPVPGTGSSDVVIGNGSMLLNNTGSANTTIGDFAMSQNVNGGANTAVGYGGLNQNDGYFNSTVGVKSLAGNTTGDYNSNLGAYGMNTNQTGKCNTTVGSFADMAANNLTNATAIGCGAIALNSNELWLGDVNTKVWTVNGYNISDGRFKRNVTSDKVKGLEFINLLRPVTYNFDAKGFVEFQTQNMPADKRKNYLEKDFSKTTAELQTGFIAQEVEEAARKSGYSFSGVHTPENASDAYGVSYYQFVVPLVKAVQEQQQMINELKQALAALTANGASAAPATGINHINGASGFDMHQNEPNPFTHETVIRYNMPKEVSSAQLAVYDLSGKQVTSFDLSDKGASSITITSDKLAAGIYIYSIVADGRIMDSKRMVVAQK